jgi:hypothetical protein
VEIQNVSGAAALLAGYTFGVQTPGSSLVRWPFRADARLSPGESLLLNFEPLPSGFVPRPSSHNFANSLDGDGGVLTLRDPLDRIVDEVEYGLQITNRSVGRVNQPWVLLDPPSPGTPNIGTAALDAGNGLRLNEWLAAGGTNDFIELFNPSALPVNLENWVLTDDPSIYGSTNRRIGSLTFIDAQGFARFHTDGATQLGRDHLPFRLDHLGETIRLLNPAGTLIDSIDFTVQLEAVSEGRYPDGGQDVVRFPGSTSPGAPNYLRPADSDHDGMDDDWELLHGLDPASAADANSDLDHDGMSNLDEFLSGTDPRDPSSVLRLTISSAQVDQLALRFTAQPGLAYRLEFADSLSRPTWSPLLDIPAAPAAHDVIATDPTPMDERPTRFYRVVLSP